MISNTTFPFYTSTAHQDANRSNTAFVRICPRDRLLPFQIQRSHNTSAVQSIKLIDCSGGETSLGTGYFSSIGTSITDDSSLGVKSFTSVDYIQYAGGPLETLLPYGVYYLECTDNYGTYYSEHFSVRIDNANEASGSWTNMEYETFDSTGTVIGTAIETGVEGRAFLGDYFIKIGEKVNFQCELTLNSGQLPSVKLTDSTSAVDYSNTVQLEAGVNDVELTSLASVNNARFEILNTATSSYAVPWLRIIQPNHSARSQGEYITFDFSNTDDLRHSGTDDIMYSTGGWKQRVYLGTRLNLPNHEPIEIGEELDGVFIPEQLNSTYIYQVVDYVSRSLHNGMQYLFIHDSIVITDEVGNQYTPGVGNGHVGIDWNTFDTGSLRVDFNDGSMTWVNDQANIT